MKKLLLLAIVMLAAAGSAFGQNCNFAPVPANEAFGNYSTAPSGSPQTTTTTFNVQCSSNGVQVTVSLSRGSNSASFSPRTMKDANGTTLNYNLYVDAANTQIWGDGTGGTVSQTYTMGPSQSTLPANVTIFASLPLGQNVELGSYSDTITATLSWIRGSNPATTTVTFQATAAVVGDCTVSAFSLNFGTYDPLVNNAGAGSPLDSTTTINVYCTTGITGNVSLDNGVNFSGVNRRMKNGAGVFMTYEIYKDSGHATVWNATAPGGINTATSTSKLIPLGGGFIAYGRIPGGQDIPAGGYSDTLQAIVNY